MFEEATRLKTITQSLLLLSQADAGRLPADAETILIGMKGLDGEIGGRIVNRAANRVNVAIAEGFGFGGQNAVAVFSRYN